MVTLVQDYFSASAARFPDKTAIACGETSLTFTEAERRSNQVANALCDGVTERGSMVPFFLPKSTNAIVALLSILKADCAYVPLDVKSGAERIRAILKVCKASCVLVDDSTADDFRDVLDGMADIRVVNIDAVRDNSDQPPTCQNLSIDLAYVLFTSGSTGTPKGVMIPHKAIVDYIDWCVSEYALSDNDVIANHAPLYFDNSTFDLYTAFAVGATLHLVDDAVNQVIPSLVRWIRDRGITTFFCVPSVLTMLARTRRLKPDSFPQLRHMICAGEVLPPAVLKTWMELYPHVQFTNMYGPTEITVDCSWHVVDAPPSDLQAPVPIGKARPNMELFVRDDDGNLSQQIGARGELLVRGTSVAYGYLGDPQRSADVFIQNPANTTFHDPLYCTGDLVEIDSNGNFLFLGRRDHQIKHLGHRIELGEIESALASVGGVSECVVVFRSGVDDSESAIGALVSATDETDPAALKNALSEKLPAYMIPAHIVMSEGTLPKTPNGKFDRKAALFRVFPDNV